MAAVWRRLVLLLLALEVAGPGPLASSAFRIAGRTFKMKLQAKPLRQALLRGRPAGSEAKRSAVWSLEEAWKLEEKNGGLKSREVALLGQQSSMSKTDSYPPAMPNYAWWTKTYGGLVPTEITDLCGGNAGTTKWEEVSPKCAVWVVTTLRCSQVCNNSNRFKGFGQCMKDCGVKELKCDMCTEGMNGPNTLKSEITRYCNHFCPKYEKCECAPNTALQSSDEFFNCVGGCVYECGLPTLDLELKFGFPIAWRDRKCPHLFFACGGVNSTSCMQIKNCPSVWDKDCIEKTCHPPLGTGMTPCYFDDPFCGGRSSFPDQMNETTKGMLDVCSVPRGEEIPCGNYPLWKEAGGFPVCEEGLICDNSTHLCAPPPPPPPPPNVTNVTNATNATNATNETVKPTLPPHPQWHELRISMHNLTAPPFHVQAVEDFVQLLKTHFF